MVRQYVADVCLVYCRGGVLWTVVPGKQATHGIQGGSQENHGVLGFFNGDEMAPQSGLLMFSKSQKLEVRMADWYVGI